MSPTAELLMRSRYSAFVVGDVAHLLRTWHPTTRPSRLVVDPGLTWLGLEVLATTGGGLFDTDGTVSFVASSSAGVQRELSSFTRFDGAWTYVSGVL